jgi:phosphoglycerol transferase MdoB-like AlkP superfamily enzyme
MKMKFLENLTWRGNIYVAMLMQLLLAMSLFTICRIGFYLYNTSYFPDMTIGNFVRLSLGGLRFDLTAVLYINALIIVMMIVPLNIRFRSGYQIAIKFLFFALNGIALAMNVVDFIYYKFTQRRTTADIFLQFENETNLGGLFFQFLIDYWYAVLFWFGLVWLMVKLYQLIRVKGPMITNRLAYYGLGILFMPLIMYLFAGGVRGGFKHSTRPITLSNAGAYVNDPREVNIVLNTPFALFRTMGKTKIQKIAYYKEETALDEIYNPIHTPSDTASFTRQNVVIIILESFSTEFFGVFNQDKNDGTYKGYTPFLDSLAKHSLTFEYSFANGRKSIDGLPSVLASIPSFGVPYVLTPFASNRVNSLGSILRKEGYHTSFFHGAPNGSMGFDAFLNIAGFEHYFGLNEYPSSKDFDGMWGVWDHQFLNFYADKLNEFPQPFLSSFFSVSSHHPFRVPEEFEGKFKGGDQPILKCIEYTDYALRQYFKKIATMPWYENTIFVITADHISSNTLFPETRTTWGSYAVPIMFFKPDGSLQQHRTSIAQQIDIMPSVLGMLHYNKPYIAFGRDLFREQTEPFAFNYGNAYNLIKGNYLIQFDGKQTINLFDIVHDRLLKYDLKNELPEVKKSMEDYLKAIIQQYNNRMVDNRLTVE